MPRLNSRVRAAFNGAAGSYDGAATMQRAVMRELFDLLPPTASVACILDAGCGTGAAGALLAERWPDAELIAADFAERMLPAPSARRTSLCADVTALPLADASVDLYWSNLTLQWCDLPVALAEARRVMRPGALLAVSTLAQATFAELRDAFSGIDGYAHTLALPPVGRIEDAVRASGLREPSLKRVRRIEWHADLPAVLRSIKAIGAHELNARRRPGLLGKQAFAAAAARFERHRQSEGLPLSYEVVLVVARR